jgi:hypothetical protein
MKKIDLLDAKWCKLAIIMRKKKMKSSRKSLLSMILVLAMLAPLLMAQPLLLSSV